MFIMTAKVDRKKIVIAMLVVGCAIAALLALQSHQPSAPTLASVQADTNDDRVNFLKSFGWEITPSPTENSQVKIPGSLTPVLQRYNALQISQGYDLSKYPEKVVSRYVYEVKNYPDAQEPVYATLLVYRGKIIGGDITDTGPDGKVQGFSMSKPQ